MIDRNYCTICNSKLNNIYILNNVPIKLTCTIKPKYKTDNLSFSQCTNCNTIQLDKLIPLNILYSKSHNFNTVGQIWTNYFNCFISLIQPIIINKNILEIGCPSGKLALESKNYNKWIIVEPNKNKNIQFNDNIIFIEQFFDSKLILNDSIDIIIHSHLFEHIYNPNDFLSLCYKYLNNNGQMFFGVPNMDYMQQTEITPFLGVFFEHTVFLNKDNISYLLNKNNFEIINIYYFENHSILFHCKKTHIINYYSPIIPNYINIFHNTLTKYFDYINYCNNIINSNIDKIIYIFGASYNTQLLFSLGLNYYKINAILDNSKDKQTKYLYGYNIIIQSPNIITKNSIIILKNGYYYNEIYTQLKNICSNILII